MLENLWARPMKPKDWAILAAAGNAGLSALMVLHGDYLLALFTVQAAAWAALCFVVLKDRGF